MFSTIMIPVNLAHADKLDKAMTVATEIAKKENAGLIAVGVTTSQPSTVAYNPEEFERKLGEFAAAASEKYGLDVRHKALNSHDPVRDLDDVLMKSIGDNNVDLVVMASHVPGVTDYIFASNAGYLASHAPVSVFVVR